MRVSRGLRAALLVSTLLASAAAPGSPQAPATEAFVSGPWLETQLPPSVVLLDARPFREFLSGRGEQWIIRPDLLAQVNRVWDRLEERGSPELRDVLQRERARYHGLQDFTGRTIAEWGELLEIQVPEAPFVTASRGNT